VSRARNLENVLAVGSYKANTNKQQTVNTLGTNTARFEILNLFNNKENI
jgi:hypothetical protein